MTMDTMTVKVRIARSDPSSDEPDRLDEFEVTGPEGMRVLDVLRDVYETKAHDLAFQYACRIGRCGTCAVKVNGKPVLSCQERATADMTLEPLTPFPVVRDLVFDRTEVEQRYTELELAPQRTTPHLGLVDPVDPADGRRIGVLGTCIGCMICVSGCPAVEDRPFDGPAFMVQLRRLADLPADQGDRVEQAIDHGMQECFGCDACTQLCPADLSPADAIRAFRKESMTPRRRRTKDKDGEIADGVPPVPFKDGDV